MEKQIRNIGEIRSDAESRSVEGYTIVFNSMSENLGGFGEIVLPEVIDGMVEKNDIP